MYNRHVMDVDDALRAVDAALDAASAEGAAPLAVAVVDDNGDLVAFARADGAPLFRRRHAVRKAYTASRVCADLSEFAWWCAERDATAADYADGLVGDTRGGVVVRAGEGAVVGAVGVESGDPGRDERLARIALAALLGGLA